MKGDLICKFCGVTPRPKESGEGMHPYARKMADRLLADNLGELRLLWGSLLFLAIM